MVASNTMCDVVLVDDRYVKQTKTLSHDIK
jgi:hypothetical protein